MPNITLYVQVDALRQARLLESRFKTMLRDKQAAFDALNAPLITEAKAASADVARLEAEVKALGRLAYDADQTVKPCPGVTVKLISKLLYRLEDALGWAKETRLALLPESLDAKSFEKIASATPLGFVTYSKEPRVEIATDLGKALAGVDLPTAPVPVVAVASQALDDPFGDSRPVDEGAVL